MNKCSHCPVAALCVGQRPGHAFACETVRTHGEAGAQWAATESAALNVSHPMDGPPPQPAPAETPAADFAALRNATKLGSKNCWFSERDAGCGCNGLQCHLLGRRINIYDCVKCLGRW